MATKTRETRDERKAREQAEGRARAVASYRERFLRERVKVVVEKSSDALLLSRGVVGGQPVLTDLASQAVWCALNRLESAWQQMETVVRWLTSATEEANRYTAQRRVYGSHLVGQRGSDVDAAQAALYVATEAARETCTLFGVYSPLCYDAANAAHRAYRLRFDVVAELSPAGGLQAWRVTVDGQPLTAANAPEATLATADAIAYETEDAAWAALAVALGDRI